MKASSGEGSSTDYVRIAMIPSSPLSAEANAEIRIAWLGAPRDQREAPIQITLHAGRESPGNVLQSWKYPSGLAAGSLLKFRTPARALLGRDRLCLTVEFAGRVERQSLPLEVLDLPTRSTDRLDGAFVGLYHWSEKEGRFWNEELKSFEEDDWRDLVRAQSEVGMGVIVLQESFRNEEYVGKHDIPRTGYNGHAFYPSKLHPGRMEVHTVDPMEVILSEADRLGMHVFMPVGMYAWFDFTPGSLQWHKEVAEELWERYGHHPAFYGWYVSEEAHGNLGETAKDKENLLHFFGDFSCHCRELAPEKPVMLATNCHWIRGEVERYRFLLRNLDILCPFGFHRMPFWDQGGEAAAQLLQELCDEAGAHLWLDLEVFLFGPGRALVPRPLDQIVEDFRRFPNFEKVICYQFPGLFNAPWTRKKPGGPETVKLFNDYQRYLQAIQNDPSGASSVLASSAKKGEET